MAKTRQTATVAVVIIAVCLGVYAFKHKPAAPRSSPPLPLSAVAVSPSKPGLQLPAPKVTPAPAEQLPAVKPVAPDQSDTNRLGKILAGQKLTSEQIEAYLQVKGRTSATLLAAFNLSLDEKYLREAMQKFPNDPRVAFAAVTSGKLGGDELREWTDAFERADPNNALANYLSALAWFNAGQSDPAANELLASAGKPGFQDYTLQVVPDLEQAYLAAGYSEGEAKLAANSGLGVSIAQNLIQVGKDIVRLADGYQQAGDAASAQSALLLAANLGNYYADSSSLIVQQLVGWSLESQALKALPPDSAFGNGGQTVQDELNRIAQQKSAFIELMKQPGVGWDSALGWSNEDLLEYFNVMEQKGEMAAMQWMASRRASQNH